MTDFLKEWLKRNKIENEKTLKVLKNSTGSGDDTAGPKKPQDQQQPTVSALSDSRPSTSTSGSVTNTKDPRPSTSKQAQENDLLSENESRAESATKPSDLIFENDSLKLSVIRGTHRQQTKSKFRLTDHMFYLSIVPKTKNKKMPLLVEILNFLYVAFNFILNQLKKFYNPADRNIAFITIAQNSMLNGLNSGIVIFNIRHITLFLICSTFPSNYLRMTTISPSFPCYKLRTGIISPTFLSYKLMQEDCVLLLSQ